SGRAVLAPAAWAASSGRRGAGCARAPRGWWGGGSAGTNAGWEALAREGSHRFLRPPRAFLQRVLPRQQRELCVRQDVVGALGRAHDVRDELGIRGHVVALQPCSNVGGTGHGPDGDLLLAPEPGRRNAAVDDVGELSVARLRLADGRRV